MTALTLHAPFDGWLTTLDAVPDAVFAQRMMGDGLAIDPLGGTVLSPCDAAVIAVAPTGHSVTLRAANGAELLIHVGVDTVTMKGEGFGALMAIGAQVKRGDPLLSFDLDRVVCDVPSAITPIVVTNEGFAITLINAGRRVASGDPVAEIVAIGTAERSRELVSTSEAAITLRVPLASGLHARPAARIVTALKPFAAEVVIEKHGQQSNARSVAALLAAGIVHDDEITVRGRGADAGIATRAVADLIRSGMGESGPAASFAPPVSAGPVRASPGFAVGPAFLWRVVEATVVEHAADPVREREALARARAAVGAELEQGGIADAHRALLDDPELIAAAEQAIAAGRSAAFAWRQATRAQADALRATGSPLIAERAADMLDIERQVIAALTGETPSQTAVPDGAIIIADELLPSEVSALDPAHVAGICTARGGPTSHAAILAASAGIPMIVAAGSQVLAVKDGAPIILDADAATINLAPDDASNAAAEQRMVTARQAIAQQNAAAAADCVMADGTRIEVFANVGSADDARRAVALGAEGCGLLRTEFLFLDRSDAPDEAEQRETYAEIASGMAGRPLIVRTLDVGGDKPLAYLPMPGEENPALGGRGIRLSLAHPDLLRTQFRAILTGVPTRQLRVMLPMIVDVVELRAARAILDQARDELGIADVVPLGVMVETPAAALLAASIAAEADFLSIGSNDLTQYALAADRGNPAVAGMIDALHPAVLALIASAGRGAQQHGRWLGVCGGIASDPAAAAILIGLGATELSAVPAAVPAVKAAVCDLTLAACRRLAEQALACGTAADVRALIGDAV